MVSLMRSEPEAIELLGFRLTFHSKPGSRIALVEWEAPPVAEGVPLHVHAHTEEGFYVLRGELALLVEDTVLRQGAGSYTIVRPGQRHSFWNPAARPAAYLTPISPGGVAEYLRELAIGLRRGRSETETAALRERLGERYDVTILGPPPER
jgi:mannose-6-phosphate isomerase-like protein (cupin superfamily)